MTTRPSEVVINIVRKKVDQARARMLELLLPVDDQKDWAMPAPTPSAKPLDKRNTMV